MPGRSRVVVGVTAVLVGFALAVSACEGDSADRDCANQPIEVPRAEVTPLGFSGVNALAEATRSWTAAATLFDLARAPAAMTSLDIAIAGGEGPVRYQDPEVYGGNGDDRGRLCREAVIIPITVRLSSADGRIALAETAEIAMDQLQTVRVQAQWMLPSSSELFGQRPLMGQIDVPPGFLTGHTATGLMADINLATGHGALALMAYRRTSDALSAGPAAPFASW